MALPEKLLIANRGEIACRIARTARRLNVRTVAVFSDADAGAPHVAACDEALRIGSAAAADSYLRGDAILAAARRSGADSIHPGYGFLAENAGFAEDCAAQGLIFVGPPPAAIRAMGSKAAAKTLMAATGVPLTPGYHGERQEPAFLAAEAGRIGYPVLIKASAGGGGKGMRRVDRPEEFAAALAACRRESAASFGDDRVLIERYVLRPRHVEIQVFADRHGGCVSLFERDCSVQRRHQKVLEEAPAPGMTAERRSAMGAAAVAAARAVGYAGAGTVEFIVAPDGAFYFMEMNTRLQVEHPVTEMITGLDLVEWQLRVAGGEPLPETSRHLAIRGHAIEARIYAENPERGFLPAIGRLEYAQFPAASVHVRVDAGVAPGSEITPYYDALLAKLIVWDETRARALARLQTALAECRIVGVATNVEFLQRLACSAAFTSADLDTALIEREHAHLFPRPGEPPGEAWIVAALAVLAAPWRQPRPTADAAGFWHDRDSPWSTTHGWRIGGRAERTLVLRIGMVDKTVGIRYRADGWDLAIDGSTVFARAWFTASTSLIFELTADGTLRGTATVLAAADGRRHLYLRGAAHVFAILDPGLATAALDAEGGNLRAPMPGRVVALLVDPGSRVARGTPLLVLEAMKMEHTIQAPHDGQVRSFKVAAGEQVAEGVELVDLARSAD